MSSSLDRRRRRAVGAELKDEDGLENEEAAGNPAGGTPTPSSGVGVSTRRTTYVVVRKIQSVYSCFISSYFVISGGKDSGMYYYYGIRYNHLECFFVNVLYLSFTFFVFEGRAIC